MSVRALFYGDGRLRAPWRLAVFLLASGATYFVLSLLAVALVPPLAATAGVVTPMGIFVFGWLGVAALLVGHAVALRWLDRRPWGYAALDAPASRAPRLARGFLVGALAIGLPSALLLLLGWLEAVSAPPGGWMRLAVVALVIFAPAALAEELLVRGYAFAVLREAWGWRPALAVTSVVFGVLHVANPGATAQSIALVTLAGIFLGAVLLSQQSLYAAWMAHLAWNWTLLALLHTEVSGVELPTPRYEVVDAGPDWATGGRWGPEGGAGAALGMLGGLLYLVARRRRAEP